MYGIFGTALFGHTLTQIVDLTLVPGGMVLTCSAPGPRAADTGSAVVYDRHGRVCWEGKDVVTIPGCDSTESLRFTYTLNITHVTAATQEERLARRP